ncbi:zinc finger protein 346 [Eucyclogobius newberryi]|uniref:zinc finger protein 346 n=1 Tax=Eucyclogobius newberryi TaxID=166745 RepID=UPI003B5CD868
MADTMQTDNFPYLPSGLAEVNKMIAEHSDLFSDSQCKVCSAVLISESQKLTHYQSKKHANKVRRYFFIQNENEPTLKKPSTEETDCNNGETDRYKACLVCNMTFTSPVMAESHYQGKVHARNLRLKTVGPQNAGAQNAGAQTAGAQTAGPQTAGPQTAGPQTAGPQTAGPQTAGPQNTAAPQTTAPPTVQAKKQKTGESSLSDKSDPDHFCSVCQASFNNPLMARQHYQGKKHQKHLKKQKLMETYGPATAPATTVKGYPCAICKIELNSVEQYQSHISGAKHKNQLKKAGLAPSDTLQASDVLSLEFPEQEPQQEMQQEAQQEAQQEMQQEEQDEQQYGAQDEQQYGAQDEQWQADPFAATDETYVEEDPGFCEEYQTYSKN